LTPANEEEERKSDESSVVNSSESAGSIELVQDEPDKEKSMAAFYLKQKIAKINDPNNSIDEDLDESD
jgi:hypothetical protein